MQDVDCCQDFGGAAELLTVSVYFCIVCPFTSLGVIHILLACGTGKRLCLCCDDLHVKVCRKCLSAGITRALVRLL